MFMCLNSYTYMYVLQNIVINAGCMYVCMYVLDFSHFSLNI